MRSPVAATWTQVQSVDGKKTHSTLSLGFVAWSAAWVAAIGSFGSFVMNFGRAFGWWH